MSDLLLEIGLEEVPAGFMPGALKDLGTKTRLAFEANRLGFETINIYGTPRRLVVCVKGLARQQEALRDLVRGPSEKVAYDTEGNPSKALLGFARSQGVAIEDLQIQEVKGVNYVFADKYEEGAAAERVLEKILPDLILRLEFPKAMRWGSYHTRYVRPIHWVVALLDDAIVPFALEMVESGRTTRGHRFLGSQEIVITSANTYLDQMEENWVIVDPARRKDMILAQMQDLAQAVQAKVQEDLTLLEEVVYLVEYPTALMGEFNPTFLDMPPELVITPMKEHQRYFPVFSSQEDSLLNRFITVRNGNAQHIDTVRQGNEHVLTARLSDALFFYEEDLKINPASQLDRLKEILFQEKLGTVYDKCLRLKANASAYGEALAYPEASVSAAVAAAGLCKTDLVSHVVMEFPELQGIMGERYLLAQGTYTEETAQAVREHYMPRFAGDDLPTSGAGVLLSLADKMDTIVGCFAAGIEPTGSQDPYALRRQASGVVHIILAHQLDISLHRLIDIAMAALKDALAIDSEDLHQKVYAFFEQRLRTTLQEEGFPVTFTRAVLAAGYENPLATVERAKQCDAWMKEDTAAFEGMSASFKRANNLAKHATHTEVFPEHFESEAEHTLYQGILTASERIREDVQGRRYSDALRTFLTLNDAIANFFDQVMVMADDEEKKSNRLSLLRLYTELVNDIICIDMV